MTTISELQRRAGEVNKANGWRETDYTGLPDDVVAKLQIATLALITTEVSEAIEEVRDGFSPDYQRYIVPTNDGRGFAVSVEHIDNFRPADVRREFDIAWDGTSPLKPEGVPSELADIVIRALDFADAWGIDLEAAVLEKLAHNATRGYRHGGKTA